MSTPDESVPPNLPVSQDVKSESLASSQGSTVLAVLDPTGHRAERLVLIFELVLVIVVVFGDSILASVYPLISDEGSRISSEIYYSLYLAWRIGTSVAFVAYVLFRKRVWHSSAPGACPEVPRFSSLPIVATRHLLLSARQVRLFEWCLVCLVAFGPPTFAAATRWAEYMDYSKGLSGWLNSICGGWDSVLHRLIALSVLGCVLYRRGGSFSDIGLRWTARDAAWALPLFLLAYLLTTVALPSIYWLGRTFGAPGWHPPDVGAMIYGRAGISLGTAVGTFLNGFSEELIVRAFLMTEVIRITRKPWVAVVISVAIQTSYHFYQGVPLGLSHIVTFTAYALFYARTRSVLPVALAHMLTNLDSAWNHELRGLLSP